MSKGGRSLVVLVVVALTGGAAWMMYAMASWPWGEREKAPGFVLFQDDAPAEKAGREYVEREVVGFQRMVDFGLVSDRGRYLGRATVDRVNRVGGVERERLVFNVDWMWVDGEKLWYGTGLEVADGNYWRHGNNERVAEACVGATDCKACVSCKSCGHCKSGGSCGVCRK